MKKLSLQKILKENTNDLRQFASAVLSAVRPGILPNKTFIIDIWRERFQNIPLDRFKQMLVAAHRAGLLELSRADLVQAFPKELVDASEIKVGNADFHFVKFDEGEMKQMQTPAPMQAQETGDVDEILSDIERMMKMTEILKGKLSSGQKFSKRGLSAIKANIARIEEFLAKNPQYLE